MNSESRVNFIAEPSLAMIRRSVFEELGLFNADLAQISDLEFLLRVASNRGLAYMPEQLCHVRIHRQSASFQHLSNKKYMLSHLDPIILAWHMLHGDYYNELRKNLSHGDIFKLKRYLEVRSHEAAEASLGSIDNEKDFLAVARNHKEIHELRHGSGLTRLLFALVKFRRKIRAAYVSFLCR